MTGDASRWSLAAACACHLALTAILFVDVLVFGRVPYLRDIVTYYYPDYVFAASALRGGVWPLWNHTADAGAPFLMTYPGDLLMLLALGARRTLMLSPPLHVWLGMCGATVLARELGWRARAAWLSGAAFGLSGVVLSSLNLFELAHGACWLPLVVALYLRCLRRPGGRSAALLGVAAAILASTLAGEVMLQAALAAAVLTRALPSSRAWRTLGAAAAVAAMLAAPVVLGLRALLEGGARAAGFTSAQVLQWSARPIVLGEMLWPRLLGDPHTMTNLGYWGQPYFSTAYPYLISLYVGPLVVALAACAGRGEWRLWLLVGVGLLVALGSHGPLAPVLPVLLSHFRTPVKFLVLTTLALALLAGRGLEQAAEDRRKAATWCLAAPAALFLTVGLALALGPQAARASLSAVWPRLASPEAAPFVRMWPPALLATGALGALAAVTLWTGPRTRFAPALCVVADLLATNARVEASAPPDFYDLRAAVASLVRSVESPQPERWFAYGISNSPGLSWSPALLKRNDDVWLYYMDRQILWGRAKTYDGLEGALDEDRTGWAPPGSTLPATESSPAFHRRNHPRLRAAGVRWILSFLPLPEDLAAPRGEARFPEILQPLVLYELRDALPRAFWVPACEVAVSAAAARARAEAPAFDPRRTVVLDAEPPGKSCGTAAEGSSTVRWRRLGPHAVEIEAEGDAGWLVFLEGYHREWSVEGGGEAVQLTRANGRYWALPVPHGRIAYRARFRPSWVWPAATIAFAGIMAAAMLSRRQA